METSQLIDTGQAALPAYTQLPNHTAPNGHTHTSNEPPPRYNMVTRNPNTRNQGLGVVVTGAANTNASNGGISTQQETRNAVVKFFSPIVNFCRENKKFSICCTVGTLVLLAAGATAAITYSVIHANDAAHTPDDY